jgi:ABC-type anion transport system duplicated permease subunit
MNSNVTGLVVAIVGVAGTLSAALLTQFSSARTKKLELEDQHEQREKDKIEANLEKRRAAYVKLNRTARAYRRALRTKLDNPASPRAEVEQAQTKFENSHAEVQLIAHAKVMVAARRLSRMLHAVFHRVIESETTDVHDLQALRDELSVNGRVAEEHRQLREFMREDLGVTDE